MTAQEVRYNYDTLEKQGYINSAKVCIAEFTVNGVHYECPLSDLKEKLKSVSQTPFRGVDDRA